MENANRVVPDAQPLMKFALVTGIFVTVLSVEALVVAGLFLSSNRDTSATTWTILAVSMVLSSWLVTQIGCLFMWKKISIPVVERLMTPAVAARYMPSEQAYRNILYTLVALAVVDESINQEKRIWIETFHSKWFEVGQGRFYTDFTQGAASRESLLKIAQYFRRNGPALAVRLLEKNKIALTKHDQDILIKMCFLLATVDGPISANETKLIVDIAKVCGVSQKRLAEL